MKEKKVLWVNPSFLDYRIPLYTELKKLFNNNFFILYSKNRIPERCHTKTVELLKENALYIEKEKLIFINKNNQYANKRLGIPFPKGLYKEIKKNRPNIIISEGFFQFTPWAVLYSFLHRKPLLIAYERTAHTERNCPFWRHWYRRFIGLFVNGYIANGTLTKEYLISQGVKAENIFTGGMCADSDGLRIATESLNKEEKQSLRSKLNLSDKGLTFIFVGQMIPRKGVEQLLSAWSKHSIIYRDDKIILIGDGFQLPGFKKKYENVDSIIFTSKIDYSEIYKYYAISDVFIIPTLEDNWSLVVPEAMACGLPIACSIYNGCHPELVKKDVNGITFDPMNEDSILDTLQYFHNVDLASFGKHSKEIELNYNPSNTAQKIYDAINKF